jgi:hypothetical protein
MRKKQSIWLNIAFLLKPKNFLIEVIMFSENLLQTIKKSYSVLQVSLDKGWQEFKESEDFLIGEQLHNQMDWWCTSKYFGVIPNPGAWYSSQLAAKYFLREVGKLGIYFDTIYPGNFSQSVELERDDGLDVRRFQLTAFHQTQPICVFQVDFIHDHGQFYFLYPPQLSIFELEAIEHKELSSTITEVEKSCL